MIGEQSPTMASTSWIMTKNNSQNTMVNDVDDANTNSLLVTTCPELLMCGLSSDRGLPDEVEPGVQGFDSYISRIAAWWFD